MNTKSTQSEKGYIFSKKNKVSVWVSQAPYIDIPDEYFEESYSKNNTRAKNRWSDNFKIRYFKPELMETNGAHEGTVDIKKAAGECSFSTSFMPVLMSKAKKKNLQEITWIVLLFEHEYSLKLAGVEKDEYLTFLGAFDYDDDSDSFYEVDE